MVIVRSQLRAARAILGWSQADLADAADISLPTIGRIEPGDGPLPVRARTADALRTALEKAGVEFIDPNGGGPGVRLAKKRRR